jgi:hypothetical protein
LYRTESVYTRSRLLTVRIDRRFDERGLLYDYLYAAGSPVRDTESSNRGFDQRDYEVQAVRIGPELEVPGRGPRRGAGMRVVGAHEVQARLPYLSHGVELGLGMHSEPALRDVGHGIDPLDPAPLPGEPAADFLRHFAPGRGEDLNKQGLRDYEHGLESRQTCGESGGASTREVSMPVFLLLPSRSLMTPAFSGHVYLGSVRG